MLMSMRGRLIRWVYLLAIRLFFGVMTRLQIEGTEHIPLKDEGPLIVVSNHFSMYEVPLLAIVLPRVPTYFGASELINYPVVRYGFEGFPDEIIFVNRGTIDRQALKAAQNTLANGRWLAIFPEGGITELTIAMGAMGDATDEIVGHNSRLEGTLLPARPGAALLAVQSRARILPIAFIGTEHIEENLKKRRRTPVKVKIGPPIGPFHIDLSLRGRIRREQIDRYGHQMMEAVARLFPAERRGYYRYLND